MHCEVCLWEGKEKSNLILRTVDLNKEEIHKKLKGLKYSLKENFYGIDIIFSGEKELQKAKGALKDFIYAEGGSSMEEVVGRLLKENGLTLSVAESCTGGLLSARIVNVPGSSSYFMGGVVVYSNELKVSLLGVKRETIEKYGAVSEETCKEMLKGLRERFKTDCGIAITGIAGPGGTEKKPEGLTYIGVYLKDKEVIKKRIFNKGRNKNRFLSTQIALNILRKLIEEER